MAKRAKPDRGYAGRLLRLRRPPPEPPGEVITEERCACGYEKSGPICTACVTRTYGPWRQEKGSDGCW